MEILYEPSVRNFQNRFSPSFFPHKDSLGQSFGSSWLLCHWGGKGGCLPGGWPFCWKVFVFHFLVETRWFQQCSFSLKKTHISPFKVAGKMIFLFHRWDMLVPRRVSYLCCWGCYFPWLSDYQLTPHFPMSSSSRSNMFKFRLRNKSMERVVRLESVVETKHLAVSQTKTHILGQFFWGSLISWQFHTIPISCLTPLMANMYSRYNVYIYTYVYLYITYIHIIYIDCQISDYDLDGTLYMWLPSETPGKRCCIQKNNDPPPERNL